MRWEAGLENFSISSKNIRGRGKRFVKRTTYRTLARELIGARDVGFNPLKIDFGRLDDGPGIEQTLRALQAC